MGIEFCLKPHLAGQIGVSEIDDHRAPYGEVDGAGHLCRHRLDDGNGQAKRVAPGEWAVHRNKGRAQARDQPDFFSVASHRRVLVFRVRRAAFAKRGGPRYSAAGSAPATSSPEAAR